LPDSSSSVCSLALQPRHPLPGILDFGRAGIGVFPEEKCIRAVRKEFGLVGLEPPPRGLIELRAKNKDPDCKDNPNEKEAN